MPQIMQSRQLRTQFFMLKKFLQIGPAYCRMSEVFMLESLKIFVSVAERGSINSGAEACFITPPAAMKRINSLEDELGLRLFERSGRGVKLTPAGKSYLADAKNIIALAEQATANARRAAGGSIVVRAGTSILNPCRPLIELWNSFTEQYPQFRIEIVPFTDSVAELSEIYAHLGRRFDVMFGVYDKLAARRLFNLLPVGESPFVICVPSSHRLSAKKQISPEDLAGERVIIVKMGLSPTVDKIRAEMEKHPDICLIDSPEFYDIGVFNRVAAEGVLLLSVAYWADVHPSVTSVPLKSELRQAYGIIYPLNPPQQIEKFIGIIGANYGY